MLITSKQNSPALINSLSFDPVIKDLLFFSNSNHPISGFSYRIVINITDNTVKDMENDPSIIWTKMEIEKPITGEYIDTEIGYFPSYYRLGEKQKYLYLKWLEDISKPASTSFLMILLYCLERNIVMGNHTEAMNAICYLREHHTDEVFLKFSLGSSIACAYYWNNFSLINEISFNKQSGWYWHNNELLYLLITNCEIDPEDFIKLLLSLHCTKYQYFKDKKEEYKINYRIVIEELFKTTIIHMNDLVSVTQLENRKVIAFINAKIDDSVRMLNIPDLINNQVLVKNCKLIHEHIKRRLKKI